PRCDSDLEDLYESEAREHLEQCRAEWVQVTDDRWGVVRAWSKPDVRKCRSCGTRHNLVKEPCPHERSYPIHCPSCRGKDECHLATCVLPKRETVTVKPKPREDPVPNLPATTSV